MAKGAYIGINGVARKVKKMYVGVPADMPSGYTKVEYIESTGTQYIDTGVVPGSGYTAELDFTATYVPSDAESWIIGVFDLSVSGYPRMRAGIVSGSYYSDTTNGAVYTGDPGSRTTATVGVTKTTCSISLYLFSSHEPSGAAHTANSKYKLYSCKIYNGSGNLVKNLVPAIRNSDGAAGLYDTVGGTFLTNSGTGVFTTGQELYSVARKIKKAYIGIGGVARPFWSSAKLEYYGQITSVTKTHGMSPGVASVGDYGIVAAGSGVITVEYYDKNLTHGSTTSINGGSSTYGAYDMLVAYNNDYAIFAGGFYRYYYVDAYDNELTRKALSDLSATTFYSGSGAGTDNHLIIGGGGSGSSSSDAGLAYVYSYDSDLTRNSLSNLSASRARLAATAMNNEVFFGGGRRYGVMSARVDVYDTDLTRTYFNGLSEARDEPSATYVNGYVLFCGGQYEVNYDTLTVDAINSDHTVVTVEDLSAGESWNRAAISFGELAIICTAYYDSNSSSFTEAKSDIYDSSLTKNIGDSVPSTSQFVWGTRAGNYAVIGNGSDKKVWAYKYTE